MLKSIWDIIGVHISWYDTYFRWEFALGVFLSFFIGGLAGFIMGAFYKNDKGE